MVGSVTNPYQAPAATCETNSDNGRVWIALIPFFLAVIAVVAAIAISVARPFTKEVEVAAIAVLGTVLIFDLPVCAYLLVKWLRAGIPPDLIAELMESTPEEREFHRQLRIRPELHDSDFYETFYARSDIPQYFVVQMRDLLESVSGYDLAGLHPGDDLALLDGEMDFADVLYRVERDFSVKLDWDEFRNSKVTFDFLLRAALRGTANRQSNIYKPSTTTDA